MNFEKIVCDSYQRNDIDKSDLFFSLFYEKLINYDELIKEAFKYTNLDRDN